MRPILYITLLLLCISFFGKAQFSTQEFTPKPLPPLPQMPAHIWQQAQEQPGFTTWSSELQTGFRLMNYARVYPKRYWDSVVVPIILVYPFLKTKESASLQKDLEQTPSLPPFSIHLTLQKLAQEHAEDIWKNPQQPSHTNSKGVSFSKRINQAGIQKCAAENISIGSQAVALSLVLLYLDIDIPSLGHRKNLLNPQMVELGLGWKQNESIFVWVQDLACKQ
ncbi:MAG: CAP domain-containing protein [Hydrotalea sp.]|nr:CAP domain-containing protein [Hydrotalea sp.]